MVKRYFLQHPVLVLAYKIQMVKKYVKKCSPSLAIKEMKIKTTVRFHLTPVRIAIITNNKCW
jgi:hypothetical protein